jgi:hypothetical protein
VSFLFIHSYQTVTGDPVCAKELFVIDVGEWDHIYKVLLYAGVTTHSLITGGADARCVGN